MVAPRAARQTQVERADGRAMKPALLAGGRTVQVPPFVLKGDVIRVSVSDGKFLKRVSK